MRHLLLPASLLALPCTLLTVCGLRCREAVHKMLQADVSGCPVINEQGQLVGVLSESDLIWKVRSTQQQ